MIYVDRKSVHAPSILNSPRVFDEKERMAQFFTGSKTGRKQMAYRFNPRFYQDKEVKDALGQLFHGKCAYCESPLNITASFDVDQFRPKNKAMGLDGSVDENHYWWLAYEWNNLYASCRACNHAKRTRFPVDGKRSAYGADLEKEATLLMDPCDKNDFTTSHFTIDESGEVIPLTQKGEVTIEVFKLNRKDLVVARRDKIEQALMLLTLIGNEDTNDKIYQEALDKIYQMIQPESPYSFAVLQYIGNTPLDNQWKSKLLNATGELSRFIGRYIKELDLPNRLFKGFEKRFKPEQEELFYSLDELDSIPQKEAYFGSAKRIQKIEIKNFKIIRTLTLEFTTPTEKEEPWMVLLGENGSGKSSVIQAIALTLGGEKKANALGLNAADFVNRNAKRETKGHVKIYLEGLKESIDLHFSKDSERFRSNFQEPKMAVLPFGSTRLMSKLPELEETNNITNLKNLFDPFAPLPNIENWLGNPRNIDVDLFDKIAIALKKLLQLPEDKLIYRRKNSNGEYRLYIKIKPKMTGFVLRELSAGYQSIFVLTLNIMKELLHTWKDFTIAEGIVVIDEIGTHLHPKWKMQIISSLREVFPALNFVVSTHEPLCLRGVNQGEVVLMKFDDLDEVIGITDLPSPKSLTVEQLITSKFFGLITSFDPEVELQLNRYYLLNSKRERSDSEEMQFQELRNTLEGINMIDERDNLDVSHSSLDVGWIANPEGQESLKKTITSIWNKK